MPSDTNPDTFRAAWNKDYILVQQCGLLSDASYIPALRRELSAEHGWRIAVVGEGVAVAIVVVMDAPYAPQCIVACRGTVSDFLRRPVESLKDWATNFAFGTREGRHCGFAREADKLRPLVLSAIKSMGAEDLPLVITGHSQGGGLAVNLAFDLQNRRQVHRVVTFGSPRNFTKHLAALYECSLGDLTWRVENGADPVTWTLPISFDHVGRLAYLDNDGTAWPRVRRRDAARRLLQINHMLEGRNGYLSRLGVSGYGKA